MSKKVYRGACSACSAPNVLVKKFSRTLHPEEHFYLCLFCANTFSGNTVDTEGAYKDDAGMMRHTCALANMIVKQVREMIEDLALRLDAPGPATDAIMGIEPVPEDE